MGTKNVFAKDNTYKVGLIEGKSSFIKAAEILALKESILPLEVHEDLMISIPDGKVSIYDKPFIEKYITKKFESLNFKLFGFHFDLGIDELSSVILQIVDDNVNKQQRRNNILNPNYKYIGISSKKLGSVNCIYIAFGSY